jgi:hypothetical protein
MVISFMKIQELHKKGILERKNVVMWLDRTGSAADMEAGVGISSVEILGYVSR